MFDRAKISVGGIVQIKPDPFGRTEGFRITHDLPLLTTGHRNCGKKGRVTRTFSPLADDIVVAIVACEGDHLLLRGLEFNLSKLEHGHNHNGVFAVNAFSELQAIMQPFLVNPGDIEAIIPGLPRSNAWWQEMEIACNYYDPLGRIKAAYQNCTHPSIRGIPKPGKGQTCKISGDAMSCNFYDKYQEAKKRLRKWEAVYSGPPIQRIEFTLRKNKLIHYFSKIADSDPSIVITEGKLRSFTFRSLASVHRVILSELQGFCPGVVGLDDVEASNHARFIAHLALQGTDAHGLIEQWFAVNPPKNPKDRNTRSRLKKDVRTVIGAASPLDFDATFTPESYLQQPSIPIPKLEQITRREWRRTNTDPQILKAYGVGRPFIPPSNF